MVALPSDTITLPLLPRVVPRGTVPSLFTTRHHSRDESGLSTKQIIILAIVSSVLVLSIILSIVVCAQKRKRRAAMSPKDAIAMSHSSSSSSSSSASFIGGSSSSRNNNNNNPLPPLPETTLGPRPLDSHLSPQMHDVPLTAGVPALGPPPYGYGAHVDGLRVPGMAAKPVSYGYHQAPVSHFSTS